MTHSQLGEDSVQMVRDAAALINAPGIDDRTATFARSALTFAAKVFEYTTTYREATATIKASDPLPTPISRPSARVLDPRRIRYRQKGAPSLRVPPEHYVTRAAVDASLEWYVNAPSGAQLHSEWGRRADCFLIAAMLVENGQTVTPDLVAEYTGLQANNASTMLNDLVVHDVLRRVLRNGRVHFELSNWTKEALS
jgi:hypothetical protein